MSLALVVSTQDREGERVSARPYDIDPRKMLYFATVVEHGSFNKAAKALRISQPALSLSMDNLELEVGSKLFERGPGGVLPTDFANLLYVHARRIRDELVLAREQCVGATEGTSSIRFACLPSLASSVIPTAITRWRTKRMAHPLRVFERVQIDLLSGLLRREFDFIIGVTDNYDLLDGLRQRVLYREQLSIIARATHPLLAVECPDLSDLVDYPWVCPPAGGHNTLFETVLNTAGLSFREQATICSSATLLKSIVEASDHLALLPAHAVRNELSEGRLAILPVQFPELDRSIAVFFRDGYRMDEASSELVQYIQAAGQEICGIDRIN